MTEKYDAQDGRLPLSERPWMEAGAPPGKPKTGVPTWVVVLLIAGAVFFFLCSVVATVGELMAGDDPAPATPQGAGEDASPSPQRQEQPTAGTRDNPLQTGEAFQVEDWQIRLSATRSGDGVEQLVREENMFNEPPPEGQTFAMVEVTVTYQGEDSGTPWTELTINLVTPDGEVMQDFMACGVIPNPLTDVSEVLAGGTASGNMCSLAPTGSLDGALWLVEPIANFRGTDRVYVEVAD